MRSLYLIILTIAIVEKTSAQFFGGGFGGYGGFGCSQTVPTIGEQCHMIAQDNTLVCIGNILDMSKHKGIKFDKFFNTFAVLSILFN